MSMRNDIADDAARLEHALGDPHDGANPVGQAAVLAADERGELRADAERVLDRYGFNAELVPVDLGGRLTGLDRMARVLRSVFRRDSTLGLGYGVTNLVGAVPVWAAGDGAQQRQVADLLLRGDRIAAAYTELDHGNDLTRCELSATRRGDQLVINGGKGPVNNADRAGAAVVFARTGEDSGPRSHSHLLIDMSKVDQRVYTGTRYPTVGVRGCRLTGIEFRDYPVAATALLGAEGTALDVALRAFQVTRCVLPSLSVGVLDSQLRTVLTFVRDRNVHGRKVIELPHARRAVRTAFIDLLIADCFTTVAARGLHLLPGEASATTAAVKYFVPELLRHTNYELSIVLGARSYLRSGPYGTFQKHTRDLAAVSIGHANQITCLATIIPQLPFLARGWARERVTLPGELFELTAPVPPLRFDELTLTARGRESLTPVFAMTESRELVALRDLFLAELRELTQRCVDLPPRQRTHLADSETYRIAARYTEVLAAATCLGVWRTTSDPFLGGPWIIAALRRLAARLGRPIGQEPDGVAELLDDELRTRHDAARTFDLAGGRIGATQ